MSPKAQPRVAVITGMASVCAAGNSPDAVLAAMHQRPTLSPPLLLGEHCLPYPFFAVDEALFPEGRRFSALDTVRLAAWAVQQALNEAALPPGALGAAPVFMGTTAASALHFLRDYTAARTAAGQPAPTYAPPKPTLRSTHNTSPISDKDDFLRASLALALVPESHGPRLTLTNACTSGTDAVGLGLLAIREGANCALCGGADALSMVPHTGFARLMIYADEPCRPFDAARKGLNLGEGAAVLVLEEEQHARQRGATILGRVLGYGAAADAHHFTAPHPEGRGLRRAVQQALQGFDPQLLAFVNAHATATPENDKVEGGVLRAMGEGSAEGLPVWASKGATGHTLGAAGALEAVLTVAALRRGLVPPSPGFEHVDPAIGLSPTTKETVLPLHKDTALSTSLGFGGGNAALWLQGVRA